MESASPPELNHKKIQPWAAVKDANASLEKTALISVANDFAFSTV